MEATVGENEISVGTPLIDSESANVMLRGLEEAPVICNSNWADEPAAIGVEVEFAGVRDAERRDDRVVDEPDLVRSPRGEPDEVPVEGYGERVPDSHLVDRDGRHGVLGKGRLVGDHCDPVGVVLVEPDRTSVGEKVVGERQRELRVSRGRVERPVV